MKRDKLILYNTLKRNKEKFVALKPPFVGLYVCGPTVYGDAHLGHARPAITFDTLYRYLNYCGFKVRYVRNITDVGHLVNDADEGEDKILKKAHLEKLEPMEVVQLYMNSYHKNMRDLNTINPNIEPQASGHIIEQQQMIDKIVENGYAYEINGSVYFDVETYNNKYEYGKLSGRNIDELISNTRKLDGQDEKRNPFDFALWKKASDTHIMKWPSKWGYGFPGWHLECSCMSQKYLGETFDIHGGGLDLQFPHHECEIAQSVAALGHEAVRYWMHNNMVTINGQKMGKSLGNFITLDQLFSGNNEVLDQAYSPMTVRFFMFQAHYRSPLDFSNEALKAAKKGYDRLMEGMKTLKELKSSSTSSFDVNTHIEDCFAALDDDLNTPILVAKLFDIVRLINSIKTGNESISEDDLNILKNNLQSIVFDIMGFTYSNEDSNANNKTNEIVDAILNIRQEAKANKEWGTSDKIRDELKKIGIIVKDTKDGFEWKFE